MVSLVLSRCVDGNDSPSVSARGVVSATGTPRCDLLDQPRVAVGIGEGEERSVARALGVRPWKACFHRERRAVPHLTHPDATVGEFLMCRFDVGDNQRAHGGSRRGRSYSVAEGHGATRAGRRELHDANVLYRGDILVEPPTQALVELLGSFDVGHGDNVDFEVHGNFRYAGVRFLLIHVIYLWLIRSGVLPLVSSAKASTGCACRTRRRRRQSARSGADRRRARYPA